MPRDLLDRSVSSVGRKVFPATRVRVFANRVTGLTYGIEHIGTHIDPWPVYGRFTEPLDAILEDGRLYDQPIRELLDALGGQQRATFASKTPLRSMSNLKRAVRRSDR